MGTVIEIPYSFQAANGITTNLCCSPLSGVKLYVGARLKFPLGTNNQLLYRFLELRRPPDTNITPPSGPDITARLIPTGYYVGDGETYRIIWGVKPSFDNPIIGMYATNNTGLAQMAAAVVSVAY